jgi:hypothetical protein
MVHLLYINPKLVYYALVFCTEYFKNLRVVLIFFFKLKVINEQNLAIYNLGSASQFTLNIYLNNKKRDTKISYMY